MKSRLLKILGIGLSAGLIFTLIGALFAAPVSADLDLRHNRYWMCAGGGGDRPDC